MFKKILMSTVIFFMYLFSSYSFSFSSELDNVQAAIEAKGANWVAGETSISRLSVEEREKRLGVIEESSFAGEEQTMLEALTLPVPANLNWRNHNGGNFVTSIKDQGGCGSCWAFGTTAALESYILIKENLPNTDLDLAEQVLISCSGAGDCGGGGPLAASSFLRDIGLPLEVCYPYTATNGNCSDACENWESETYKVGKVKGFASVSAEYIKYFLTMYGPIVVSFNIYSDFFYYTSGIYSYTSGYDAGSHCCSIVGYDDDNQCFIVKNSWGTGWGETGFFRIAYSEVNSPVAFNYIIYYTEAGTVGIAGRVTDPAGAGIKDVRVMVYANHNLELIKTLYTNTDGTYRIEEGVLPFPQFYKVFFDGSSQGYFNEWYDNKADIDSADEVYLKDGQISEINAILTPRAKYTAPYVSTKMTVDGKLNESDWDIATDISSVVIGTTNNTSKFGVLWDSYYLYVGVEVLDDNLYNDSRLSGKELFDDDSVEIAIDGDHNRGTKFDTYDRYFLKGWHNDGLDGYDQNGVLHGWETISGGYSIEMAIPWSNLGITPTADMTIGFSVGYNDDDDGDEREGLVVWAGTTNNWQDTSALGDIVLGEITGLETINNLVDFEPITSTYETTSDTIGCGDGFVGQFIFDATLTNKSDSAFSLSDLVVKVRELTNGNLLQNADGGAGGVGSSLTVQNEGDYADGVLSPGESVDVNFIICLTNSNRFRFVVDVLGTKEVVSSQALEALQSTDTEPRRVKLHKRGFFGRFRPNSVRNGFGHR